jgi:Divergent InlB B-repeat domain
MPMAAREFRSVRPIPGRTSHTRFPTGPVILALLVALTTQAAVASQLQLTWIDNSGGQAAFQVVRRVSTDTTYTVLTQQPAGVTAYGDGTVAAGITYCYRVQAYDTAGSSPYSNEACGSVSTGLALTVSVGGTGQGTVSSNPAGINCPADCVETYPSGTVVTLAATPLSGSTFGGWNGGGCVGTSPCTLTGNAAIAVGATFAPAPPPSSYTLSVSKTGPGSVKSSPAGINCGSDCSESYPSDTTVILTAAPATGANFLGWTGACTGTGSCSVTLSQATSVSAAFSKGKGRK